MSVIEKPMSYRYLEIAHGIINYMVETAFTANRYVTMPLETTELYYDRIRRTVQHVQDCYTDVIADALERMITAPENCTEVQLQGNVTVSVFDGAFGNDQYEEALDAFTTALGKMSPSLAIPADEQNIDSIDEYFNVNLPSIRLSGI